MELKINNLGINGEGVAKQNGKVCFVPFALPDEIVDVDVKIEKENFCECELKNIIKESSNRQFAPCPYFMACGGCDLQHLKYEKTLEYKQNLIKETLKKIANIDFDVLPTFASKEFTYRNKMVFAVAEQNDKTVIGMFERNTHKIVEIEKCLLASEGINTFLSLLREFITKYKIRGFDYSSNSGVLKFIVLRKLANAISIVLVCNSPISHLEELASMLPKTCTLDVEINSNQKQILGGKIKHIFGEERLKTEDLGIKYFISPHSFLQINNDIKHQLYESLVERINAPYVIDAYSGAGVLTAIISKKVKHVWGIEIVKSATRDANELVEINGIKNMTNINGDCGVLLPELVKKIDAEYTIVLDPPKAGIEKSLAIKINALKPQQIIYISCNPKTLARDLALFSNFSLEYVKPFDMFPQTVNVETLAVLNRKKSK